MNSKAIEARRAYKRKWAKENPDKVKQYQEKFWAKKAAEAQKIEPPEEPAPEGG